MLDRYAEQVRLLLGVLPDIAAEEAFALKGGTAINLFYRDMPRLSIDIDLAYLPVTDRAVALNDIDMTLSRITETIANKDRNLRGDSRNRVSADDDEGLGRGDRAFRFRRNEYPCV